MRQVNKIFNGKKLRAVYDGDKRVWLVSVIDVVAAITNSGYDAARNHWKQIKYRLNKRKHALTRKTRQIKLLAKDGLYRNTDVMDYREIVKLIQALPYKTAMAVKDWVGDIACKGREIQRGVVGCIDKVALPREHCFIRYVSVMRIF